jgi:exonuclease VII small subunit
MSLIINNFSDLLKIVETHPEWRRKLVKALFPEVDLPKALQELAATGQRNEVTLERLAETVARLEANQERLIKSYERLAETVARLEANQERLTDIVERLDTRVARLETDVAGLKTDVAGMKTDMKEVRHTQRDLKESSFERYYRDKATSIFGWYVKRGRDMTDEIADRMQDAEAAGQISEDEFIQVLAADLLWGGQLRRPVSSVAEQAESGMRKAEQVILVVETSWLAEVTDVERAVARATTLRKIELRALPVVAGREWTQEAIEAAHQQGAVIAADGRVDKASWQNALTFSPD